MRIIFEILYYSTILVAVINYGAVDAITVSIVVVVMFAILVSLLLTHSPPEHSAKILLAGGTILILSGAWVVFQTTPLPRGILGHPSWNEIGALVPDLRATISVTPADDRAGWLRIAAPVGVFLAGLILFPTDKGSERALLMLAISGGVVALLSLQQFLLTPNMLLFARKTAYLDSLTGFFVNRNTAATYFGLMGILNFSMLGRMLSHQKYPHLSRALISGVSFEPKVMKHFLLVAVVTASMVLCTVSLMLTKSRAGVGSTFVAAVVLVLLMSFRTTAGPLKAMRGGLSSRGRITSTLLSLFSVLLFFSLFAGQAILRAETRGIDDGRFCVLPGMWSAVDDNFPWGTGLSSFAEVFPAYRDTDCPILGTWDMAHNLYIEGLIALGMGFPLLLLLANAFLWRSFVQGLSNRRSLRYAPELGAAATVLVSLHSIFDFSLQVSGFAIVFAAVLAPTVTISLRPTGIRRKIEPV